MFGDASGENIDLKENVEFWAACPFMLLVFRERACAFCGLL